MGQEVAALEVELALQLAATASPVAALSPGVEPRVYERDGFAVTCPDTAGHAQRRKRFGTKNMCK